MSIEEKICKIYNIKRDVLYINDKHRKKEEVECLHFLWYFLHYHEGMSSLQIARAYNKTSRNVKYALAKIKFGLATQSYYQDIYKILDAEIYDEDQK